MGTSNSTPLGRQVPHADAAPSRRAWAISALVLLALSVLTLGFQAAYVFSSARGVLRPDGFDGTAHFLYFSWIAEHRDMPPLAFRGSYTWIHFPSFYQWNVFVADIACWFAGEPCGGLGLNVAWFLQAVLRVGTLGVLFATFRRLFRSPGMTMAALALCATSPRVFFATCIWNQDDYVFFFAAICMSVTVASIQDGLTVRRMVVAALAVAFGFNVKTTILVPAAAMLLAVLLLPTQRAALTRKGALFGLVAVALVAVSWTLFTTPQGRARLAWVSESAYPRERLNSHDLVGAYLTLNAGPIFHPEKVYVPVSATDWTSRNSFATALYLYLFELFENFQGPPRTWLNLLCVWTGTPLLGLVLWRMSGALRWALRHPATMVREDVYCAALVLLSFAALFAFSLGVPFGWSTHPEYVLAAYPAAAVLLVRQLFAIRRPALFAFFAVMAGLHFLLNLGMLIHAAQYKISLGA